MYPIHCAVIYPYQKSVAYIGEGPLGPGPSLWSEKFFSDRACGCCFSREKNGNLSNAAQISRDLIESLKSSSFSHITGLHIYET